MLKLQFGRTISIAFLITSAGCLASGQEPAATFPARPTVKDTNTAKTPDGQQWEVTFEADGRTMKDPPMLILPNLKLSAMEQAVNASNRDVRFRLTGMVTEYKGRNYILLEKVLAIPEQTQQF